MNFVLDIFSLFFEIPKSVENGESCGIEWIKTVESQM